MGNEAKNKSVPKLRFKEFEGKWNNYRLGDVCIKIQDGNYGESYPKSDEFVKEGIPFLTSKALGGDGILKEEKLDFLPVKKHNQLKKAHIELNDVLFTNRGSNVGTIGFVDKRIDGGNIGPQLTLLRSDLKIVAPLFLKVSLDTYNFKKQVNSQDSGSAMNFFGIRATSLFKLNLPSLPEQNKLAEFLSSVDKKIQLLEKKKEQLELYKKGVMQKIFSREIRFKDDKGNSYPDWEEKKLGEVLFEHKLKSSGKEEVYSVSVHKGLINQIEHLGRSFAAKNTDNYNLVKPNDIVYTKSPTGEFPYGIIKQAKTHDDVIVSPLYGVFTPESKHLGYMLDTFFESKYNVHNYLHSIIQKGAKNTINITNSTFLSKSLKLPVDFREQEKIGRFLSAIDNKIEITLTQIEKTKKFKKGLLQQMFV